MKKIFKMIFDWFLSERSVFAFIVRTLPLGFSMVMLWGGGHYLIEKDYVAFIIAVLVGSFLGAFLWNAPGQFLDGDDGKGRYNNLEVFFGEIVFMAFVIWFYFNYIAA